MKKEDFVSAGVFSPDEFVERPIRWESGGVMREAVVSIKTLSFGDMSRLQGDENFLVKLVCAAANFDGEYLTPAEVDRLNPKFARELLNAITEVNGGGEESGK